jgi:poly(3-hydroxyalkanoate) synthetase
MPKLKEPTDTWSGAGQPDIIAQWGKMRLVRYQARGPRRHPVPVLIVSPLLAKPYVLDLALDSAWLITWPSGAWSCSYWTSESQTAGTGISASRTTFV